MISSISLMVSLQANPAEFSVLLLVCFWFAYLFFPAIGQRDAYCVLSLIFNKKQWQASILR